MDGARLTAAPLPSPDRLVFYTHTCCPYAERVWITLLEKELGFDLVQIDLSSKPRWFAAISSLVPVVHAAGQAPLRESADLCRWAEEAGGGRGQQLVPPDAAARRQMEELTRAGGRLIGEGLELVAGHGRSWGIAPGQTAAQRGAFESAAAPLAASLQRSGGPYLLGRQLGLADVLLWPFWRRFDLALRALGQPALGGPLAGWAAAVGARPSCRVTAGDEGRWLEALRTRRSLDWFDFESVGLDALHPGLAAYAAPERD
eukprot:scaffold20.g7804.t1